MGVDVEEYVASFRTDLCDAVAAWSRGAKFAEIMKMTDVFEARAPPAHRLGCTPADSLINAYQAGPWLLNHYLTSGRVRLWLLQHHFCNYSWLVLSA